MLKPTGRPVALNPVGVLVARIVKLKADPTVPVARLVLVITGATTLTTVMVKVADLVPPAFVAEMETLVVPTAVGVPEITPAYVS